MRRPDADTRFMAAAYAISLNGTCPRRRVGALIVVGGKIVSTGYNGSPSKLDHCIEIGCEMVNGHCVRTIHAEANACLQAGREARNGTIYTTASPCRACMGMLINVGIERVVYAEQYKDSTHQGDESRWALEQGARLYIRMHHWSPVAEWEHLFSSYRAGLLSELAK